MPSSQRILIASDHAGFAFKSALMKSLPDYHWEDLGPFEDTTKVDYPDFAELLGKKVAACRAGDETQGILICGSGIGMSIAANKIPGIRAALVENPMSARLSREHNDANVLCLGARLIAPEYGAEIVKAWLATPFSHDPRHIHRVDKIHLLEKK